MRERKDLVVEALTAPAAAFESWQPREWARLLRQARSAGLLGRVGARLSRQWPDGAKAPWPASFSTHLQSVRRLMRAQRAEVDRELRLIARALSSLGAPVIVLKGAAYLAADLPPGAERVFSDVDILVPKAALAQAESLLMLAGWFGTHDNAYDQRYYREWMHELPPMQHVHRGTTLDLHHNILPETARLKPDGRHLVEAAVPIVARPGLFVLSPPDMVLHAMTHLLMNEEASHGLRDLSDIDLLLRHFGSDPAFWEHLLERAALLDLQRPLHYGLRHVARVFDTPLPSHIAEKTLQLGPQAPLAGLMDGIWHRVLRSPHPSAALTGDGPARFALYIRGHWLRMPLPLLARHLTIKALRLHELPGRIAPPAPTDG